MADMASGWTVWPLTASQARAKLSVEESFAPPMSDEEAGRGGAGLEREEEGDGTHSSAVESGTAVWKGDGLTDCRRHLEKRSGQRRAVWLWCAAAVVMTRRGLSVEVKSNGSCRPCTTDRLS